MANDLNKAGLLRLAVSTIVLGMRPALDEHVGRASLVLQAQKDIGSRLLFSFLHFSLDLG